MPLSIRHATLDDAEQIGALAGVLGYVVDASEMRARLSQLLGRADDVVLVGDAGSGELAGWLHGAMHTLLISPVTCELEALVVSGSHRRRGVGRQLVASLESWALARGAATLTVRSNIVRTESHAFYPGLGYARIKTQHVYRKALASPAAPAADLKCREP
jgi:GNAT superfamily N-acetyltransferase